MSKLICINPFAAIFWVLSVLTLACYKVSFYYLQAVNSLFVRWHMIFTFSSNNNQEKVLIWKLTEKKTHHNQTTQKNGGRHMSFKFVDKKAEWFIL